jgi:carbamoyltransferase
LATESRWFVSPEMRVLGIGGLAGAKSFRLSYWPNLDEREYPISVGLDAATALVIGGELVVAAKEESLTRFRQTSDFPEKSIAYCLSAKKLGPDDIDLLVHCFDYSDYEELYLIDKRSAEFYHKVLSKEALLREVRRRLPGFPLNRVRQIPNHLAHAAGAYLTSGWDQCLVVVIDGQGDGQSTTGYHASTQGLTEIKEIAAYDSIADFYSLVSVHLGFNWHGDEWQLMDLAAQGDASRFRLFFEQAVQLRPDGTILVAPMRLNRRSRDREHYLATRKYLLEYLGPKRLPNEEIQQRHKDVMAGLQECLNRVVLHICKYLAQATRQSRIALAGQTALNCSANSHLLESGIFGEVYVPTAAGDEGAAIGAALYGAWQGEEATNSRMPIVHGAPNYSVHELHAAYKEFATQIVVTPFGSLEEKCQKTAALIADKYIVARDEGRFAFGSTVFGNRSILADPSDPQMRVRLGMLLKEPTGSRPTAAAVTLEQAKLWFDVPGGIELTGSVMAVPARPLVRKDLAGVTQEDGTARIQVIDRRDHPDLHRILVEVGKLTGREVALTTSFNIAERPLVNSPRQALEVFIETGIEYLIFENALIRKKARSQPPLVRDLNAASQGATVARYARGISFDVTQGQSNHIRLG